jgi:dihydroorotase
MNLDFAINHGQVLLFKDGKISRQNLHVGVKDGKIASLSSTPLSATREINAKNLQVLPGVIDSQVHFREPGMTHKEDMETGTKSAALGGVTSIFEMPNTQPPTTTVEKLNEKFALAHSRAWVNYAFYAGSGADTIDQIPLLEKIPGCSGVKIFMGSSFGNLLVDDDAVLEKLIMTCQRRIIFHAEDEARLRERKKIVMESKNVVDHTVWRDPQTAIIATEKVLRLARKHGKRVHILHVGTAEEVELLRKNKDLATFEITPNHLTLVAPECYERLGSLAQMNPPVREKNHQDALWKAIVDGTADVIGTDHAPHTLEEKAKEYPGSPSGMPGVQTLVPVMLTHVKDGKLTLERFVELVCENPRRVFGCQSKGRIDLGLDADFTIVDLNKERRIENSWIASRCGWTPFAGMTAKSWPTHTIIAGEVIMENDKLLLPARGQRILFS